jgi:hypothetical protein
MSAVNRERRKNAGKRMAILGKKMEEEDDTFWSHETWADEEDSGNESFHESDEDSTLRKDVFDSDFNDSESNNEDDEVAAGEAEERELQKIERTKRRQNSTNKGYKNSDADLPTLGRHKRRRGFAGGSKRAIGEGFNAGIVLNLPPESFDSLSYSTSISAKRSALQQLIQTQTHQSTSLQSTTAAVTDTKTTSTPHDNNLVDPPILSPMPLPPSTTSSTIKTKAKAKTKTIPVSARKLTRSSRVSLRERQSTQGVRKLRGNVKAPSRLAPSRLGDVSTTHTASTPASAPAPARKASSSNGSDTISRVSAAAKRKRFAQEELLLEAVHETEPENQRWLHGRKRIQEQYNRDKGPNAGGLRDKYRGKKIIQKFHSRRGCLITLTFPEMDSVPEILTRRQQRRPVLSEQPSSSSSKEILQQQQQQQQLLSRCVITGKIGNYKDPLTNYPYHDLAAFKELRRRHKDGVAIVNKRVVTSSSKYNGGGEDSAIRKVSSTSTRKNSGSKNNPSKGEKNKQSTSIVDSSDKDKSIIIKNREELKKSSSSAINTHHKLPFQSPKSPPRPTMNGSSILPKAPGGSKLHPSNGNIIATNQEQSSSIENLAFSWGATDATSNSPVSPSGRRLSPRKWKPSEKVLETISMLPGKYNGGIAIVPRGLGIQPLLTSSSPNHQCLDNSNNKSTVGYTPVVTRPSSSAASEMPLAPKPQPSDKSLISSMEGKNQTGQDLMIESADNGGHNVPTSTIITGNSMQSSCHNKSKGSNATPKSEEVANHQKLVNANTPITGSSVTVAIGHSKEDEVTDSSSAQVLSTSRGIADTAPLTGMSQHKAKLEDSVPNGSATIGATGDDKTSTNMKGQVGGIKDIAEPIKGTL